MRSCRSLSQLGVLDFAGLGAAESRSGKSRPQWLEFHVFDAGHVGIERSLSSDFDQGAAHLGYFPELLASVEFWQKSPRRGGSSSTKFPYMSTVPSDEVVFARGFSRTGLRLHSVFKVLAASRIVLRANRCFRLFLFGVRDEVSVSGTFLSCRRANSHESRAA